MQVYSTLFYLAFFAPYPSSPPSLPPSPMPYPMDLLPRWVVEDGVVEGELDIRGRLLQLRVRTILEAALDLRGREGGRKGGREWNEREREEHAGTTWGMKSNRKTKRGREGGKEGKATYGAKVHGVLDDIKVIGEAELGGIHGLLKNPAIFRLELLQDEGEELMEGEGGGGREGDTGVRWEGRMPATRRNRSQDTHPPMQKGARTEGRREGGREGGRG